MWYVGTISGEMWLRFERKYFYLYLSSDNKKATNIYTHWVGIKSVEVIPPYWNT